MHTAEEPKWMACEDCEASGHPAVSQSRSGYNPTNAATRAASKASCAQRKGGMATRVYVPVPDLAVDARQANANQEPKKVW
jgi:hypothetical protein